MPIPTNEPAKVKIPIGNTSHIELSIDHDDREFVLNVIDQHWPYMAFMIRNALEMLDEAKA